jgi:hypothetical protein
MLKKVSAVILASACVLASAAGAATPDRKSNLSRLESALTRGATVYRPTPPEEERWFEQAKGHIH